MTLSTIMGEYKAALVEYLSEYLTTEQNHYANHYWSRDVFERFIPYVLNGKMWRGMLVMISYQHVFGGKAWRDILPAAAAVEILCSAVLTQDDIIDRDELRRGKPSLHAQYVQLASQLYKADAQHIGESYGICVADVGIFLSQKLLPRAAHDFATMKAVQEFYAGEFVVLALSEMLDVHQTLTPDQVSLDQTLEMYRYKTARYTFATPLVMGGLYAQAEPALLKKVDEIGELIGLIFQIKDDELGLFGTEEQTGKPVTSDVREGKRTPYYLYAKELASAEQQAILQEWYGNSALTTTELEQVRQVVIASGAKAKVDEVVSDLAQQVTAELNDPVLTEQARETLAQILQMNLSRSK